MPFAGTYLSVDSLISYALNKLPAVFQQDVPVNRNERRAAIATIAPILRQLLGNYVFLTEECEL